MPSISVTLLASCDSWDLLFLIGWYSGIRWFFLFGGGVLGYRELLAAFGLTKGGVGGGVRL